MPVQYVACMVFSDMYIYCVVLVCLCLALIYNSMVIMPSNGHFEIVKYLLSNCKFVLKTFVVGNNGDTSLTVDLKEQKQDVVDYLIKCGISNK